MVLYHHFVLTQSCKREQFTDQNEKNLILSFLNREKLHKTTGTDQRSRIPCNVFRGQLAFS